MGLFAREAATLRALLDRFGASRIDCEDCDRDGVLCSCPRADQQLLPATGCTPNAAAQEDVTLQAAGGGRLNSE